MSKFVYDPSISDEIKRELRDCLDRLEWLIPGWCQRVFIKWESDGKDGYCISSQTQYEYRFAALTFYPAWHTVADKNERRQMVIHDLLHAFSCPLRDYADNVIERALPGEENKVARKMALEEMRMRDESFIQDLSFCLNQKLYPTNL